MTARFCATLCGAGPGGQPWSSVEEWRGKCAGGIGRTESFEVAVRVATLHTAANNAQGLQAGLVVSAATTVWLPGIPANHVYVYLCDGSRRADWDTFFNGVPVQQEDYFAPIQFPPHYAVSVLRPEAADGATHKKVMLQQMRGDQSCKLLAYAPIDEQALKQVMRGGSHAAVSLLPSGFVVLPDGRADERIHPGDNKRPFGSATTRYRNNDGCIVSVLFQRFLGGPAPQENITKYIIDQLGTLVSHSVVKIKEAVHARVVVTVTA
ncbi:homeobox-leucine zipper protein ROC6 [Lolium perenne]|uniref:homeobox-leucine zipper protein ROC6 n=1 Tax=Lolium perenne TaxID=4522 RepID=UPI003A9A5F2C